MVRHNEAALDTTYYVESDFASASHIFADVTSQPVELARSKNWTISRLHANCVGSKISRMNLLRLSVLFPDGITFPTSSRRASKATKSAQG